MAKLMATTVLLMSASLSFAADKYNDVSSEPEHQKQYNNCVSYANKKWEGGKEKSPIAGQNKAQAFCTCMWNETPDDFTGGLAKFSESPKGAAANKTCEKYADWYSE